MEYIQKEIENKRMWLDANKISNIKYTKIYPMLNDNTKMQFIVKNSFLNVNYGQMVLIQSEESEESEYYLCIVSYDDNRNPILRYCDFMDPEPIEEDVKLIGELEYLVFPVWLIEVNNEV